MKPVLRRYPAIQRSDHASSTRKADVAYQPLKSQQTALVSLQTCSLPLILSVLLSLFPSLRLCWSASELGEYAEDKLQLQKLTGRDAAITTCIMKIVHKVHKRKVQKHTKNKKSKSAK